VSWNWIDRGDPAVAEMLHLATAAVALDRNNSEVLRIASDMTALHGDLNGGIALISRSISLNPNDAAALEMAGLLHAYAGETQAAISYLDRAARLNPLGRTKMFYFAYAVAHFVAGEHEAVVEWTEKVLRDSPNSAPTMRYRVASLGLLDRLEEGRQTVQRLLEQVPDFTIARARRHIEVGMSNIFKTPGVVDSFYEGLRRCGVPE